jgi:zinc/manganese transport system substrate-binding protein
MKIIILFLTLLGHSACAEPLKVVASFPILGDIIRTIGGTEVNVSVIVPENADPHVYQPTTANATDLSAAHLVVTNGLGFEGWMTRLIESSGYKGEVVVATDKVTPRLLPDKKTPDPHAWHDVQNGILYVQTICAALIKHKPEAKQIFEKNAQSYIKKLKDLDQWVKDQYHKIPEQTTKIVITTHDAFSYYGNAYGITFKSPVGISTEAEPSATDVAKLIELIRKNHVKAVFIENLAKSRLIQEIALEAAVNVDGELYADSLSDPASEHSPAKTYIEMIKHNTIEIITALTN